MRRRVSDGREDPADAKPAQQCPQDDVVAQTMESTRSFWGSGENERGPEVNGRPVLESEMSMPELILRQRGNTARRPDLARSRNVRRLRTSVTYATRLAGVGAGDDDDHPADEEDVKNLLTDSQLLAVSARAVKYASVSMMCCVLSEGIQEMAVMPNYPLMVTPGAHPESFPNTSPFGITAAQYVLCAATAIAMMISNLACGKLADKYGQRRMVLVLTAGTICCNIAKYFARSSFWAFTALCFVNGLFGGNVAVANSYMSLVYHADRKKVDKMIGYVTAASIASFSLGGLLTILFQQSLFMPLLVAACISFLSLVAAFAFVLDPGRYQKKLVAELMKEEDGDKDLPKVLDKKLLFNIIFGALMDNIGSLGVTPLAFSPVLYKRFFLDFVANGEVPIMSEDNYRMAYTMISVTIVPAASISTILFQKVGPAKSCVFANIFTGAIIIALIFIAMASPTRATYTGFLAVLYVGAPFQFISNISTGPMLDRITPTDKKGRARNHNAIFKFSAAVFQLLFGIVADNAGSLLALWICVGVSFFAALANVPLLLYPRLGKVAAKKQDDGEVFNETEIQELLDKAEYVPLKDQFKVNETRAEMGLPSLQSRFGTYSRDQVEKFGSVTSEDLRFLRTKIEQRLHVIHKWPEMRALYLRSLNRSSDHHDEVEMESNEREMEQWMTAYLRDSGYFTGLENAQLFKSLFVRSFPRLNDGSVVTEEGLEDLLVKYTQMLDVFLQRDTVVSKRWRILSSIKVKTA